MSKKKKPQPEQGYEENEVKSTTRSFFYIAIGLLALAVIAFALTFIFSLIPATFGVGVYMLITSLILELAALSFLTTQKKKNNFKAVFYLKIVTYVFLALSGITFVGGLVYMALL